MWICATKIVFNGQSAHWKHKCTPPYRSRGLSPLGGVLEVYMTGGSDVFFWVENLHARYFFGSRDLSRIFLGLIKKYAYFFGSYLRANFSFRVFVAISGSEKYSFELFFSDVYLVFLYFFGLEILMPGIFLGLKFQTCVFFGFAI